MEVPRIRAVGGDPPPYPLNSFPDGFAHELGKRLVYVLAVSRPPCIEGSSWEQIFAESIGAKWVNSSAELDDVRLQNCAWSGKAVFARPTKARSVRLISGRNNLHYSFGRKVGPDDNPAEVGRMVLAIWNERVAGVRKLHQHLRTVVLLKSPDHRTYSVFEKDTLLELPEEFAWHWNKNSNLVGVSRLTGLTRFTWQVNGQQFTIHEQVPDQRLTFSVQLPSTIPTESVLQLVGFNEDWVIVLK